ncbi:hypothetical protein C2E23DRAFT_833403 [Lenzites betulinus]|nr:hypothetical protein C2E23DRAFT_833403 [Lenzites betulinus]
MSFQVVVLLPGCGFKVTARSVIETAESDYRACKEGAITHTSGRICTSCSTVSNIEEEDGRETDDHSAVTNGRARMMEVSQGA